MHPYAKNDKDRAAIYASAKALQKINSDGIAQTEALRLHWILNEKEILVKSLVGDHMEGFAGWLKWWKAAQYSLEYMAYLIESKQPSGVDAGLLEIVENGKSNPYYILIPNDTTKYKNNCDLPFIKQNSYFF